MDEGCHSEPSRNTLIPTFSAPLGKGARSRHSWSFRYARRAGIWSVLKAWVWVAAASPAAQSPPLRASGRQSAKGKRVEREGVIEMAEKFVAKLSEMQNGDRRIVFVGDNEIGVFRHEGQFYAYSNFCLHQGGPACEGLTIAKVEERLRADKTSMGLFFSEEEMHFVCPWHGMEYDMKTGECVSDRKLRLKKYKTVQKGDDLYVVA
jgi:nitrite reductase/ring-hydroxylating ferredoxin subunit